MKGRTPSQPKSVSDHSGATAPIFAPKFQAAPSPDLLQLALEQPVKRPSLSASSVYGDLLQASQQAGVEPIATLMQRTLGQRQSPASDLPQPGLEQSIKRPSVSASSVYGDLLQASQQSGAEPIATLMRRTLGQSPSSVLGKALKPQGINAQLLDEVQDSRTTDNPQSTIQRDLDEDIITDELTTKCCYRGNSSLEPVLTAIRDYNQGNSLKNLAKVLKKIGQMPSTKKTKYQQPLNRVKAEIKREEQLLYLKQHHQNIPEGVNDAKDYEDSIANCALTSVGALLELRVSDIVGKEKEAQEAFFINYEADLLGEKRPEKQTQTGSYGDNQVERQKSGIKHYVMSMLDQENIELENTPDWENDEEPADVTIGKMAQYPPGTRYIVYARKKSGGAHFVYAEHTGAKVTFYDYQRDILYKRIKVSDTKAHKKEEAEATLQYHKNLVAARGKKIVVDSHHEMEHSPGPEVYDRPITVNYSSVAKDSDAPENIGNPTSIQEADQVSFIAFVISPPPQARSKDSL